MENGPFIDDFPIKTSIYKGFSMAMLNSQRVYGIVIYNLIFTTPFIPRPCGPHASVAEAAAEAVVQPQQGVAGPVDLPPPPTHPLHHPHHHGDVGMSHQYI